MDDSSEIKFGQTHLFPGVNLKRTFLYTLIASVATSALVGIWVILFGNFGSLEARVLGSTLTVVGTSILGLACGAFLESPKSRSPPLRAVPICGIALSLVSALVGLYMIWFSSNTSPEPEFTLKFLALSVIFAVAFAHLSLLSLARLSGKFLWSLAAAYLVILGLASVISYIIVFEPPGADYLTARLIGVLAVADAALTVLIPIFHRLSQADFPENREPSVGKIDAEIEELKRRISELEREKWEILNYDGEPKS